ncbi:MAG: thiolase domain-containing protein [Candidatus Diapherotrites archaeon]|nr:thiolase domain-containing protein [Candidatus Diapherotrites archaeon]
MRSVSIISVGLTKFGENWGESFRDMIAKAAVDALKSNVVEGKEIEAIFGGTMASGRFIGQEHIGALIADQLGLNPIPSTRVEAACASGGVALRQGYTAVASGMYDIVAVGGAEKMTDVSTEQAAFALGGAGDQETELFHGATFPALYALLAQMHMQKFGTTEEMMAACSVKNHANGMHNPIAQFHKEITISDVMNSGYIATPLKLLDCSPITDGAAVLILCETSKAKKLTDQAVEIIGSGQASDSLALTGRKSLTELMATRLAAKDAYKQAGMTAKDIDLAEVHDCFSVAEILAIEDLGFFKKGDGGPASLGGETAIDGKIAINTSGGLKSDGHPVGATGVKQAAEIFYQLNGIAGKRQRENAKIGLSHNVGGSGATAVVHVYRKA